MPAACRKSAEEGLRGGRLVEVKRLGIEFGGEPLDVACGHLDRGGAVNLPGREIVKKERRGGGGLVHDRIIGEMKRRAKA